MAGPDRKESQQDAIPASFDRLLHLADFISPDSRIQLLRPLRLNLQLNTETFAQVAFNRPLAFGKHDNEGKPELAHGTPDTPIIFSARVTSPDYEKIGTKTIFSNGVNVLGELEGVPRKEPNRNTVVFDMWRVSPEDDAIAQLIRPEDFSNAIQQMDIVFSKE